MRPLVCFSFIAMLLFCINLAAADKQTDETIQWLIKNIEQSNFIFIRNGVDYKPKKAAAHIKEKYNYYKDKIHTPEEFIENIASKSSITGRPYLLKDENGTTQPVKDWLMKLLKSRKKISANIPIPRTLETIIAVARQDAQVNERLEDILSNDASTRQFVLKTYIADMKQKNAPPEFVTAIEALLDNNVADAALLLIKDLKRENHA